MITIGLFGTCGGSQWRTPFKLAYEKNEIAYFDPQVDDWTPELAVEEARHLAEDRIILFPVLGETYGTGSLAETGFSILQAIRLDSRRDFVLLIEPKIDDKLTENLVAAKESTRSRALVLSHLRRINFENVYIVDNLDDMLNLSMLLYEIAVRREAISRFSAAR